MIRQRSGILILGSATAAAIVLVCFFKAPPIAVCAGTLMAVAFLLLRNRTNESEGKVNTNEKN